MYRNLAIFLDSWLNYGYQNSHEALYLSTLIFFNIAFWLHKAILKKGWCEVAIDKILHLRHPKNQQNGHLQSFKLLTHIFVGLAYLGNDIVFRLILEYSSSLGEFGPEVVGLFL
jgi:hypothetical protein